MRKSIEAIAAERDHQLTKYSIEQDVAINSGIEKPLTRAAAFLSLERLTFVHYMRPIGWAESVWLKMCAKPYKERLVIAAALIAAEIERLEAEEAQEAKGNG